MAVLPLKHERWEHGKCPTRLVITIEIEPRPGVFIPRPQELARHLRHSLITRMGDVQFLREARAMREMYATIVEMVHFKSEVHADVAPAQDGESHTGRGAAG